MNSTPIFSPLDPVSRSLEIKQATTKFEIDQLRAALNSGHYLKPNLATRCLGLALRKLPGHFEESYGSRPVLAQSFSDPQRHEDTIYQASNGTPLGFSKGFKRHKSEFSSISPSFPTASVGQPSTPSINASTSP